MLCFFFFFFKQKTAYEMRISDWSSDVCSSDLASAATARSPGLFQQVAEAAPGGDDRAAELAPQARHDRLDRVGVAAFAGAVKVFGQLAGGHRATGLVGEVVEPAEFERRDPRRSEEHTSELQSLMRNSYAVFCLKKTT